MKPMPHSRHYKMRLTWWSNCSTKTLLPTMVVRFDKRPMVGGKCRFSCNCVMVVVWVHYGKNLERQIRNLPFPWFGRTPNKSCRVLPIYTNAMSCIVTSSVIMCSSPPQVKPSCLILVVANALALPCSIVAIIIVVVIIKVETIIITRTKVFTKHWQARPSSSRRRWCRTMVATPLRRTFDQLVVLSLSYLDGSHER